MAPGRPSPWLPVPADTDDDEATGTYGRF
jgi:hypothetical protein